MLDHGWKPIDIKDYQLIVDVLLFCYFAFCIREPVQSYVEHMKFIPQLVNVM